MNHPNPAHLVAICLYFISCTPSAEELTVYAYLTPQFLQPVLTAFSNETGVTVNAQYMTANQLLARLIAERDGPSADVVFTMEARRLADLVAANVLAPQPSTVLRKAIPSQFRHPEDLWFGLSKWSRTVYYATARVKPTELTNYADLANPRWRGRLCVRPSSKVYVQSLIASVIAHDGEPAARALVRGLVSNLARPPVDLDIVQLEAITAGICDLAIANSYYYQRIVPLQFSPLTGDSGEAAKRLIAAVAPVALEQNGRGVHMNVSGFALTRSSKNPALARRLMEYMLRPLAQSLYANAAGHFPITDALRTSVSTQVFGAFKEDSLALSELAKYYELAEQISRQEGWLWE
jgi:iron(III) transport system substrate-binding protein